MYDTFMGYVACLSYILACLLIFFFVCLDYCVHHLQEAIEAS